MKYISIIFLYSCVYIAIKYTAYIFNNSMLLFESRKYNDRSDDEIMRDMTINAIYIIINVVNIYIAS